MATTAFRWTLAIAGGFAAMSLFLFAFIYWQTAVHQQGRIDDIVIGEVRVIAGAAPAEAAGQLQAWLAGDRHGTRFGGLFGSDGARVAGNLLAAPSGLPTNGQVQRVGVGTIAHELGGYKPDVLRTAAARLGDGRVIVIGYDIDELDDIEALILRALWLGAGPAVLLALGCGALLARRAQRRIAGVHLAVGRIMQGHLRERLPVHGAADDLDRVAIAVNGMLGEIERLVGEIRGVGDSIAHDLRTPLTRVRMRLERSRDEAHTREEFQAATDRAIVSVDQALAVVVAVLRIGEIEHGRRVAAFIPVDLAEVLRDAAELYEPVAEERGVALQLHLAPAALVQGDRDLLLEAVGNLLDNAIKFAPPGTAVLLSLASHPHGVSICVTDRGPGIPPEERERVLQRFYRTEKSRTVEGCGLGLSLVATVVTLHGFHLRIGDANPGCVCEIASGWR